MKVRRIAAKTASDLEAEAKSVSGMSLIELVVAVSVSSIILLAAGSVMVFVTDSFTKIIDKDEAESSINRAAFYLRTMASMAVDLHAVNIDANFEGIGAAGNGTSGNLNPGQIIRTFDSASLDEFGNANHRGRIIELAVFFREAYNGTQAAAVSYFLPTGIFFKTPWYRCPPNVQDGTDSTYGATKENCSGQLIIVSNQTLGSSALTGIFTATTPQQLYAHPAGYRAEIFDRLTSIAIETTTDDIVGVGYYAKSATITLRARYFLSGAMGNYNYVEGRQDANFMEITLPVKVGFYNNYLGPHQLISREAQRFGDTVYFFPFVSPIRGF